MITTRKKIARRIKTLRQNGDMTQKEYCKFLKNSVLHCEDNISISALSSWELGLKLPSAETLEAIADYYGVSMDYIFGRTSDDSLFKPVSQDQLPKMHGSPVFISHKESKSYAWGIYDKDADAFLSANGIIKNSAKLKLYKYSVMKP